MQKARQLGEAGILGINLAIDMFIHILQLLTKQYICKKDACQCYYVTPPPSYHFHLPSLPIF